MRGRSPPRGSARRLPTARDCRKYARLFVRVDRDADSFVSQADVKQVFLQSGLDGQTLMQIWGALCNRSCGTLSFNGFVGAMHLIRMARAGARPPAQVPNDLASFLSSMHESAAVLAKQGSSRSASLARSASGDRSSVSRGRSPPRGARRNVPTARDCRKYARLFVRLDSDRDELVSQKDVGPTFRQAGLDDHVLLRIWQAVDVHVTGRVGFSAFVGAMHLIRMARTGEALPERIPQDLADFLGDIRESAADLATQGSSRSASTARSASVSSRGRSSQRGSERNLPTARDCRKYARLFMRVDQDQDGMVSRADVKPVFARAELDGSALKGIWKAVDVHSAGALDFPAFVGAMHLIRTARMGRLTSPEVHPELAKFLQSMSESPAALATQGSSRSASSARSSSSRVHRRTPSFGAVLANPATWGDNALSTLASQEDFDRESIVKQKCQDDGTPGGESFHGSAFGSAFLEVTGDKRGDETPSDVKREHHTSAQLKTRMGMPLMDPTALETVQVARAFLSQLESTASTRGDPFEVRLREIQGTEERHRRMLEIQERSLRIEAVSLQHGLKQEEASPQAEAPAASPPRPASATNAEKKAFLRSLVPRNFPVQPPLSSMTKRRDDRRAQPPPTGDLLRRQLLRSDVGGAPTSGAARGSNIGNMPASVPRDDFGGAPTSGAMRGSNIGYIHVSVPAGGARRDRGTVEVLPRLLGRSAEVSRTVFMEPIAAGTPDIRVMK